MFNLKQKLLKTKQDESKLSTNQLSRISKYLEFTDTSDIIMNYYKNQNANGFESKFEIIENWLASKNPEENKPFIITSKKGQGKKLFLVKWIYNHLENNTKVS